MTASIEAEFYPVRKDSAEIVALRATKSLRGFVEQDSIPELPTIKTKKGPGKRGLFLFGWGRGIRTPVDGVRVRSPTTRRSPK